MSNKKSSVEVDDKDKLIGLAKNRFNQAAESESEVRKVGLEDLEFRAGEQWPMDVKNERNLDGRPCLTINKIPQFVRQITNEQRQNRPSIKVNPVDDKADIETAKIFQGMIRNIENTSNADIAYDTAFSGAVIKGFGYFRILTAFCDHMSFDQEIQIKQIPNHFNVYLDPSAKEPDGSDANWGFIFDEMSKDEYNEQFPDSELSSMTDWSSIGDNESGWCSKDGCRIAEYFFKDFKSVEIVQLKDGTVLEKSALTKDQQKLVDKTRTTMKPTIRWVKMNGIEVLEETEWPGQWIPIVPVYGDELNVNGKRIFESIVRHAKDSQRMFNYWASTETETIALAPKAPFIVADGQVPKEFQAAWSQANRKNQAYLSYVPVSNGGQPVPPPQRNAYEAPIGAITNARALSNDDLKATTGIYDDSLGKNQNSKSGIALQRTQQQSQTSNFHFVDNLARSMKHAGRIIVDLIPKIYDTARAARIIGEEGEQEIVLINQIFQKDGQSYEHQLGIGRYDVTVETGPSYATKRQEAVASMIDLIGHYPQMAQIAGDLLLKNMDWPGAQEISERLKKTIDPKLLSDNKGAPQIPPEIQQQMQAAQQTIDQLTAHLNAATEAAKTNREELESKERIEFAKLENQMQIEIAKINHKEALTVLQESLKMDQAQLRALEIGQPIDEPNENFNGSGGNNPAAIQQNQQNGAQQ